jgi:hypothetical protein
MVTYEIEYHGYSSMGAPVAKDTVPARLKYAWEDDNHARAVALAETERVMRQRHPKANGAATTEILSVEIDEEA